MVIKIFLHIFSHLKALRHDWDTIGWSTRVTAVVERWIYTNTNAQISIITHFYNVSIPLSKKRLCYYYCYYYKLCLLSQTLDYNPFFSTFTRMQMFFAGYSPLTMRLVSCSC